MKITIVPIEIIGTQYFIRARRHKKRRIDKKWLKRYGYVARYKDDRVIVVDGEIFMSEQFFRKIKGVET